MNPCELRIYSNDYAEFMTDFTIPSERLQGVDFCRSIINNQINIYHVARKQIGNLSQSAFRYLYLPKVYATMEEQRENASFSNYVEKNSHLQETGISSVKRSPLFLSGKGVTVAIIDSGINLFQESLLKDENTSRVIAYWDQSLPAGDSAFSSSNVPYGREYRNMNGLNYQELPLEIIQGSEENENSTEHGTALASIMAGNDGLGIAGEAQIVAVKLKEAKTYLKDFYCVPQDRHCYSETDLMEACKYVISFAEFLQKPLVVLLGVGTSFGDHSGGSFLSRYVEELSKIRNCVWVTPAGNSGLAGQHFKGEWTRRDEIQKAEVKVEEGCSGFFLEVWGEMPDLFSVNIRTPQGEETGFTGYHYERTREYRFVYSESKVYADTLLAEQLSGQQMMAFRVLNPTPGIWSFYIKREVGNDWKSEYNMYITLDALLSKPVYFITSNPLNTLCTPSVADSVITVASCLGANEGIAAFSSRGFALNGLVKPDLAAPGRLIPWQGGVITGSSASAAIVAGAAALFLEWAVVRKNNSLISGNEVKNILARGCVRTRRVNGMLDYPNPEWGYGMLNLENAFELLKNPF